MLCGWEGNLSVGLALYRPWITDSSGLFTYRLMFDDQAEHVTGAENGMGRKSGEQTFQKMVEREWRAG